MPKNLVTFPPTLIEFDSTDVPVKVRSAFEEALKCRANGCHVATAMLVRKTLEEICEHFDIKEPNLNKRIDELKKRVLLPEALLSALHDIRLLGNDAAHVEWKTFDGISEKELDASIKLMKKIIEGLFQMEALQMELAALKKLPTS